MPATALRITDTAPPPCATNPRLWDSTTTQAREAAVRICTLCPHRAPCEDHALTAGEPHGTWGGLTSHTRAALRHGTGADDPDGPPCGTENALRTHRRRGETCQGCEQARQQRLAPGRRRRLDVIHAAGGSEAGARLHQLLGETPCRACKAARNAALARRRRAARGHAA